MHGTDRTTAAVVTGEYPARPRPRIASIITRLPGQRSISDGDRGHTGAIKLGIASLVIGLFAGCGKVKDNNPVSADASSDTVTSDASPDAPPDAPPDASPVPPGPMLWLRFDDDPNDGVIDSGEGAHTVTCTQCPAVVAGVRGNAYAFTGDRVDVAVAADLLPGTAFTLAAWVLLSSTPPNNAVIGCKVQGTSDCTYALLAANSLRVAYHSTTAMQTSGTATLALGTWHHVAMTWDGVNRVGYVDGVLDNTLAVAAMPSGATPLSIGGHDSTATLSLPGAIDELVFYDRVLTQTELQLLATP